MKSLTSICFEKLHKNKSKKELIEKQIYKDCEYKYVKEFIDKIVEMRNIHFFRLCCLYYAFYAIPRDDIEVVYESFDVSDMPKWKINQFCACEISFGEYHTPESAVSRIRLELPFEHANGRLLGYTLEAFENALEKYCPNMNGTVHDWCKVFNFVPKKILLYEEFFG